MSCLVTPAEMYRLYFTGPCGALDASTERSNCEACYSLNDATNKSENIGMPSTDETKKEKRISEK